MAVPLIKLVNAKSVMRKFKRLSKEGQKQLERGLVKGGFFLQRKSQQMVPVNTGNLKASAFLKKEGSGRTTEVRVGYTAKYALWVHEMPMKLKGQKRKGKKAKGKYWDPQGRASNKFLEKPARMYRKEIKQIIENQINLS